MLHNLSERQLTALENQSNSRSRSASKNTKRHVTSFKLDQTKFGQNPAVTDPRGLVSPNTEETLAVSL